MNSSLERIIPSQLLSGETTGLETLKLHLDRYEFAASHIRSASRILDLACGVGYGTRILKDKHPNAVVVGVDIDAEAISYARQHYALGEIAFSRHNAMEFTSEPFDAVVSLETIEHLSNPGTFISRVAGDLLRPWGVFVGSVPITPSMDVNPYHLSDFSERSFRALLNENNLIAFAALRQNQPYNPVRIAMRTEKRLAALRKNLLIYYAVHPNKAVLRAWSLMVHGFNNKYLTLACRPSTRTRM
jgi:2-polyprenyl-3-methyl-5-hydroxy-6-metoxy-1,4-benzoquinol methylase